MQKAVGYDAWLERKLKLKREHPKAERSLGPDPVPQCRVALGC